MCFRKMAGGAHGSEIGNFNTTRFFYRIAFCNPLRFLWMKYEFRKHLPKSIQLDKYYGVEDCSTHSGHIDRHSFIHVFAMQCDEISNRSRFSSNLTYTKNAHFTTCSTLSIRVDQQVFGWWQSMMHKSLCTVATPAVILPVHTLVIWTMVPQADEVEWEKKDFRGKGSKTVC